MENNLFYVSVDSRKIKLLFCALMTPQCLRETMVYLSCFVFSLSLLYCQILASSYIHIILYICFDMIFWKCLSLFFQIYFGFLIFSGKKSIILPSTKIFFWKFPSKLFSKQTFDFSDKIILPYYLFIENRWALAQFILLKITREK